MVPAPPRFLQRSVASHTSAVTLAQNLTPGGLAGAAMLMIMVLSLL